MGEIFTALCLHVLLPPRPAGQLTPDDLCPYVEQKRRRAVRSTSMYCRLVINGHVVMTSPKFKLEWPSFELPLRVSVSVSVHRRPSLVELELWQAGWVWDSRLAAAALPLPVANTSNAITVDAVQPFEGLVVFSSASPINVPTFHLPLASEASGTVTLARCVSRTCPRARCHRLFVACAAAAESDIAAAASTPSWDGPGA